MAKNLVSSPTLAQIWSPPKKILWILLLLDVRNCCKLSLYAISRKTNEPNLRKWQKTWFRARFWHLLPPKCFSWILPVLDVRHCCKLSLYPISMKINESNLRKWQKTQFWAQIWAANFFQKYSSDIHQMLWSAIITYNRRKN